MKTIRYYYTPDYRMKAMDVLTSPFGTVQPIKNVGKSRMLPRLTICGIYDRATNELSVGIARCSQKDPFKKSVGRDLSKDRAYKDPYIIVKVDREIHSVFIGICKSIEYKFMETLIP